MSKYLENLDRNDLSYYKYVSMLLKILLPCCVHGIFGEPTKSCRLKLQRNVRSRARLILKYMYVYNAE